MTTDVGGVRNATNRAKLARAPRPASSMVSEAAGGKGSGSSAQLGYKGDDSFDGEKTETVKGFRQVGKNALYQRGRAWLTPEVSALSDEKLKDAVEVKRFSDRYFELVRKNGVAQNQIFAAQRDNEELVVKLRGTIYRIR